MRPIFNTDTLYRFISRTDSGYQPHNQTNVNEQCFTASTRHLTNSRNEGHATSRTPTPTQPPTHGQWAITTGHTGVAAGRRYHRHRPPPTGGNGVSLTDDDGTAEQPPTDDDTTAAHADTGRAGLILAGGRSERFPTIDKALAPLDGKPLLRHVADALSPAVDERIINCRPDQQTAFAEAVGDDPRFAIDPVADRGPLAGLRTALAATEATYAAVLPCDMPFVPAGFIEYLFGQAQNETGAVPCVGGQQQSLPAVVHVRAATAACADARQQHDGGLAAFVSVLDPLVVPERTVTAHVEATAFSDIDTHEDLAAIRDERRRGGQ